jgi:hypothetical protein
VENWNAKKFFLYLLTCSITLSALMGIWALISGEFGETQGRVLGTTCTIVGASVLGLACGAFLEAPKSRKLPILAVPVAGICLAALSALITLYLIWVTSEPYKGTYKLLFTSIVFAFSFAQLSLLSLARLATRFKWALTMAFISILTLAALGSAIIISEANSDDGIVLRLLGILAVVDAAATVMIPVFHRLSMGEAAQTSVVTYKPTVTEIDAEIAELKLQISRLEKQKADILDETD